MTLSSNEMDDIILEFIEESFEELDSLDSKFVKLEKKPDSKDLMEEIFRTVHTIKGAAGFLGLTDIVKITHKAEDILNKARTKEIKLDAPLIDMVLKAKDDIKILLDDLKQKIDSKEGAGEVIEQLKMMSSTDAAGSEDKAEAEAEAKSKVQSKKTKATSPKKTPKKIIDKLKTAEAPGDSSTMSSLEVKQIEAATRVEVKQDLQGATSRGQKETEHSIRVDLVKLDEVLNLAGELVLSRNRMTNLGAQFSEKGYSEELMGQMDEAIAGLHLLSSSLQLSIMSMRMLPVNKVLGRFPRMIRDLARGQKKEIELVIEGEDTELDKTVIDEIGDPLIHIVRNSADHGLESPEERRAAGKPAKGTITISAYQEGRNIIIKTKDDGRGIDPVMLKEKAVTKGLLTEEEAERLSDREALNIIFMPGFSTAKVVTDISGRGVGMDVVKTNVSRINGIITIDSEVGKGTTITFRLPITLAIIQSLTVESNGELYAIPLATVTENIRIKEEELNSMEGQDVVTIRGRVLPVVRLEKLIAGSNNSSDSKSEWKYLVVVNIADKSFCVLVDRLHGQEEILIKSMGEYLRGTEGIAGASITGDGNVVLILDMAGLAKTASSKQVC